MIMVLAFPFNESYHITPMSELGMIVVLAFPPNESYAHHTDVSKAQLLSLARAQEQNICWCWNEVLALKACSSGSN